jgi:3-methyladenine DNA glycosylase Tag
LKAPDQIQPASLADYLDVLSRVVFQTGISWQVIENKWPGIRDAFRDFDPAVVATLTESDIEALMGDRRIIRNPRKVQAIVENARTLLELESAFGSFPAYLRSLGDFEATARDLRKRFRFVGDLGAFYFLYVVGENVPAYEDWCASRGRAPVHA